jgi:AraC-like DNA-binding protein/quercetin dioxygenase-like cupin family protein
MPGLRHAPPAYFSAQVSGARRFHLRPDGGGRALAALSGGWERCSPDYAVHRSGFPHAVIEFVAHGAGTLSLDGKEYTLRPGSVFVYARHHPHEMRAHPDAPMLKYFVVCGGTEARALLRECRLEPGTVAQVAHAERVQQIFDDMIGYGLGDHPRRARLCAVALQYLVLKIGDLAIPYAESGSPAFATYQRCRRFIAEHFLDARTLRDVAGACHVDVSYLCRLFQRFGRERPYRYLQLLRMNHAADLLRNQNRRVKDVALDLCFENPNNFSRAFRQWFGIAPENLRPHHEAAGPARKKRGK